jgi:anti-sigma B factor antagonist
MRIDTAEVDGGLILRPHGPIDSTTSPALEQALKQVPPVTLLDLTGVPYVSSAGLRVVLVATKAARAAGGRFAVFGLSEAVRSVFELSGFGRIVPIMGTEAEALAGSG